MIVIGTDPHKQTHTFAAVDGVSGELRSSETFATSTAGHERVLAWARGIGTERVWAIEDCRHVSGRLERFLVARGEQIVRVPGLMIMAEDDVVLSPAMADGMERFVPDLEKVLIKNCGHWTQQEHPEETNRVMIDWLKRRFG